MSASAPRVTREGVARDHAAIARRNPGAAVATALRTRSLHAREILAELAWPGHAPGALETFALTHAASPRLPDGADPVGVADYARVVAVQTGAPRDQQIARSLLEAVLSGPAAAEAGRPHVELLGHLRVLGGDPDGAVHLAADPRVREDVADAIRADALHPRIAVDPDPQDWAEAFSRALHGPELAPFLPPEDGQPSLDRLRTAPRPAVHRPERITVLMSAYRPGAPLRTAVASVLAQTWSHLELFVVDDASGPGDRGEITALLDEIDAMDDRVHVIRKAVNGGTYRARNTALRRATGDFVIVLDSDDWWHPQTLELCAAPLLERPGVLATRAQGVRVSPDLLLTRPGYRPRFVSAATVLFRRVEVMRRIGFFDPTRKGADTEYARRLVAAFGPVLRDIPQTTTLLRGGDETLSSGEFGNGWRHPARHQYKSLYTPWHRRIESGEDSPYLDPDEARRVPEPVRWERASHPLLAPDRGIDLCVAGDWRRYGGPQRSMLEEIAAARQAGLRVAVMHLEAMRFMTTKDLPLNPVITEMIAAGEVLWIHPDDEVDVEVLLIRYPPILQYPPTLTRHVRAREVLVMANQAPGEVDGADQRYVVADVTERATELFGAPVQWVPQSPAIRRILREQDAQVPLTRWDNPGLIDPDAWQVRLPGPPGRDGGPVVVGRHSRDDRIKFPPTWEEAVAGYTFGPGYEVRLMGARNTLAALRRDAGEDAAPVPDHWEVLRHGAQSVTDFLAGLDFYLYLDNPHAHEAFGRVLLEAAASGALTIAHPKHHDTFGDLFDYAEPGQAQALIDHYVQHPEAYRERVERTLALVRERYSPASFGHRIRDLVGDPGAPHDAPMVGGGSGELELALRSSADGERADRIAVSHENLPETRLRAWLHPSLAGWLDPTWTPTHLLAEAPAGVTRVRLERDGLTRDFVREARSTEDAGTHLGPAATDAAPDGWQDRSWWTHTRPPAPDLAESAS